MNVVSLEGIGARVAYLGLMDSTLVTSEVLQSLKFFIAGLAGGGIGALTIRLILYVPEHRRGGPVLSPSNIPRGLGGILLFVIA